MNVAYLINQYPQLSHSFIRREIRALEAQGITVTRVSLRPAGVQVEPADAEEQTRTWVLQRAGIWACVVALLVAMRNPIRFVLTAYRAIGLGRRSRAGVVKHLFYLLEACLLERHVRQAGAEQVHAHFGTNSATVALLCRWLGGPPFSITIHGPEEFDDIYGLALPTKLREAAFVVAISDYGRSQLLRFCDVQHWDKVHVVRCGVDAAFLAAELTPAPDRPQLVCVGRLSEQKGHLVLLRALEKVRDRGVDFEMVFIGDGPLRSVIEAERDRRGLGDAVRLFGNCGQAIVRSEIRRARAFVLPSFAEGLPVVFMESLALGRPVLSTFVAGIPELVVDGECGWLVPAGSVDHLADAIEQVLRLDSETLTEMGRAGRARVEQMHLIDREAGRLARLFDGRRNIETIAEPALV